MATNTTMRQLTFVEAGKVEFREVPVPRIEGPGEALVRPLAVSRCDLDFVFAQGKAPITGPFPLGHECIAEVLDIGSGVRSVTPGQRVIVPFQISCGACKSCSKGFTGSCQAVPKLAAYGLGPLGGGSAFGGAVSDVLRVPYADAMLVGLPDGVSPLAAAALGDNAVDGFRTVANALARMPGASVLVGGGGAPSVGLYAVAAARALGASEVVYVDPNEGRASVAERLGAKAVREKCTPGLRIGRFPITVDATGRDEGLRFVLGSTEPEGTCTSVGIYFSDVALPLFEMYSRGVTFVTGRVHARREIPAALGLVSQGLLDLAAVATTIAAWDAAPEAWVTPAPKLVLHRA